MFFNKHGFIGLIAVSKQNSNVKLTRHKKTLSHKDGQGFLKLINLDDNKNRPVSQPGYRITKYILRHIALHTILRC